MNPRKSVSMTKREDFNQTSSNDQDEICELEHLRKLFIGGLPPYTTEESLRTFYEQWGKVVDCVVMRDTATKKSRGFGFVTYTKAYMVDKAQNARPHIVDGKSVEAKRALARPERENRESNVTVKKIFIGGLKDNHDEECLREHFSQFGNIVSVKILMDKATEKRRGFAFVAFDDYDAVDKAILQKTHSIKNVLVDVKKSVYKQEMEKRGAISQASGANGQVQAQVPPGPYQPGPQMNGPPINGPPMNGPPMNGQPQPPANYNNWGPPNNYNGYNQPPMNNWNWNQPQPPQNGWNGPPQPQWNQGSYGPPAQANWNAGPVAPQASWNAGPVTPQSNWNAGAQQPQAQPQNFGSGYQQNYGGGPQKNNVGLDNNNRKNPYNTPAGRNSDSQQQQSVQPVNSNRRY